MTTTQTHFIGQVQTQRVPHPTQAVATLAMVEAETPTSMSGSLHTPTQVVGASDNSPTARPFVEQATVPKMTHSDPTSAMKANVHTWVANGVWTVDMQQVAFKMCQGGLQMNEWYAALVMERPPYKTAGEAIFTGPGNATTRTESIIYMPSMAYASWHFTLFKTLVADVNEAQRAATAARTFISMMRQRGETLRFTGEVGGDRGGVFYIDESSSLYRVICELRLRMLAAAYLLPSLSVAARVMRSSQSAQYPHMNMW